MAHVRRQQDQVLQDPNQAVGDGDGISLVRCMQMCFVGSRHFLQRRFNIVTVPQHQSVLHATQSQVCVELNFIPPLQPLDLLVFLFCFPGRQQISRCQQASSRQGNMLAVLFDTGQINVLFVALFQGFAGIVHGGILCFLLQAMLYDKRLLEQHFSRTGNL